MSALDQSSRLSAARGIRRRSLLLLVAALVGLFLLQVEARQDNKDKTGGPVRSTG